MSLARHSLSLEAMPARKLRPWSPPPPARRWLDLGEWMAGPAMLRLTATLGCGLLLGYFLAVGRGFQNASEPLLQRQEASIPSLAVAAVPSPEASFWSRERWVQRRLASDSGLRPGRVHWDSPLGKPRLKN